jgi:hypothetical protein
LTSSAAEAISEGFENEAIFRARVDTLNSSTWVSQFC